MSIFTPPPSPFYSRPRPRHDPVLPEPPVPDPPQEYQDEIQARILAMREETTARLQGGGTLVEPSNYKKCQRKSAEAMRDSARKKEWRKQRKTKTGRPPVLSRLDDSAPSILDKYKRKGGGGRPRNFDYALICRLARENPDMVHSEIAALYEKKTGRTICNSSVHKILQQYGDG